MSGRGDAATTRSAKDRNMSPSIMITRLRGTGRAAARRRWSGRTEMADSVWVTAKNLNRTWRVRSDDLSSGWKDNVGVAGVCRRHSAPARRCAHAPDASLGAAATAHVMRDHREHRAACCTTFSLACATTRFVAPWQQQRVVDYLTRRRALLRAENGLRRRHRILLRQHRQRDPAVVHHVLQGALPLMHARRRRCRHREKHEIDFRIRAFLSVTEMEAA